MKKCAVTKLQSIKFRPYDNDCNADLEKQGMELRKRLVSESMLDMRGSQLKAKQSLINVDTLG